MTGTEAEESLAFQLRASQIRHGREVKIPLAGLHGLDYAKVDFLVEGWLVVEVDGPSHNNSDQKKFDRKKGHALKQLNFGMLRVQNEQVIAGLAIKQVLDILGKPRPMQKRQRAKSNAKPIVHKPPKIRTLKVTHCTNCGRSIIFDSRKPQPTLCSKCEKIKV